MVQNVIDPNNNSVIQRFSHLEIPTKYQYSAGIIFLIFTGRVFDAIIDVWLLIPCICLYTGPIWVCTIHGCICMSWRCLGGLQELWWDVTWIGSLSWPFFNVDCNWFSARVVECCNVFFVATVYSLGSTCYPLMNWCWLNCVLWNTLLS